MTGQDNGTKQKVYNVVPPLCPLKRSLSRTLAVGEKSGINQFTLNSELKLSCDLFLCVELANHDPVSSVFFRCIESLIGDRQDFSFGEPLFRYRCYHTQTGGHDRAYV